MGVFACLLYAGPRHIAAEVGCGGGVLLCQLRIASLVATVLWDFWMQAPLLTEPGDLGGYLSGRSHKSWGTTHVYKILPGRQLTFVIEVGWRETRWVGVYWPSRSLGTVQAAPRYMLMLEAWLSQAALVKYTNRTFLRGEGGRDNERVMFLFAPLLSPG